MKIEVKRITPENLFRECAEMTTGKECKMSWNRALCSGHSIIRAREYLIKMYDIPQCVMGHLVRHIHSQPYVLSKRPDRGGRNFEEVCEGLADRVDNLVETDLYSAKHTDICHEIANLPLIFDRHAPTSMALKLNAEEIINISKVRLCSMASQETRDVWEAVITEIAKIDPELALHCVPTCVYRGSICPEPKGCGFNKTELFKKQLDMYKLNFTK